jgi:ABC-type uncharacterized transport system substrate-binding protein
MRRREFVALLGGAALSGPFAARAQQPALPVIGFLNGGSREGWTPFAAAFRQGLNEAGYFEGQNVTIEYRWAEFQYDRLPALAADLVRRSVTVIAATTTPAALAAKAATSAIPIVFYLGVDPVEFELVASLSRPGGNSTGVVALQAEVVPKRIELLHELVPKAAVVALLVNATPNRYTEMETRLLQGGARSLGLQLQVLRASTASDIDAVFGTLAELRVGALLVSADLFFLSRREQLVALAAQHALPAIYAWPEYGAAGGLMCYGPSLFDGYRLVGVYIGKILKGAKPADLPVEQSTKVAFVINLKTAKTLGLTFPITLSGRADEVIE